uniref:Rieske domain-containing protein n=1 Tax=Macrostomum lignano TaxID=282301 RepID=A0A1I8FFS5_9PLAT
PLLAAGDLPSPQILPRKRSRHREDGRAPVFGGLHGGDWRHRGVAGCGRASGRLSIDEWTGPLLNAGVHPSADGRDLRLITDDRRHCAFLLLHPEAAAKGIRACPATATPSTTCARSSAGRAVADSRHFAGGNDG